MLHVMPCEGLPQRHTAPGHITTLRVTACALHTGCDDQSWTVAIPAFLVTPGWAEAQVSAAIAGRVLDATTGRAIANATVTLDGSPQLRTSKLGR